MVTFHVGRPHLLRPKSLVAMGIVYEPLVQAVSEVDP